MVCSSGSSLKTDWDDGFVAELLMFSWMFGREHIEYVRKMGGGNDSQVNRFFQKTS